ncbi:MAG: cation:proton antiporter [Candidatus Micrarchaeota archaeon]
MSVLNLLLAALILAYLFSEIAKRFHAPRVVGQIFAGVILGVFYRPILVGEASAAFTNLADIGIILLFFFTGLEVNLREFQRHFKSSILVSILNTAIPFSLGVACAHLFGFSIVEAIVIGICLSVSSTAISLDFLEEFGLLKTKIGNLIVTIGAVDDFLELIFISIIVTFLQVSLGGGELQMLVVGMFAFIGVAFIARYMIVPFALNVIQKEHSRASLFMMSLILTLSMATISELLGLGTLIGALIAGVLIRHTLLTGTTRKPWEEHEISQVIHTVSFGFLVPIFFIWVGYQADLNSIFSNPLLSIALPIIAIFGTVVGTAIAMRYNKSSWEEGMLVGWGVTAKGDVELVVAAIALQKGLISAEVFSALIFMAFVTTLVAPIVFRQMIQNKVLLHKISGRA